MLAAGPDNPRAQGDVDKRGVVGLAREQLIDQPFGQATRGEGIGRQGEEFFSLAGGQGTVAVFGISQRVSPVVGKFERVIIHRRRQRNL